MANANIGEIMKSKTPEERALISKKASATRRKNCAERSRYYDIINKQLKTKININDNPAAKPIMVSREELMIANLVNRACSDTARDSIQAFQEIRDIQGDTTKQIESANAININGNQVQIIFADDVKKLSK